MSRPRIRPTSKLTTQYSLFLAQQSDEWRKRCAVVCRDRQRKLDQLLKQGVVTVADLLERLPSLSSSVKQFGIELIALLRVHAAIPNLLELMSDPSVRVACATTIFILRPGKNAIRHFVEIGRRELTSSTPDPSWLEAVIYGLGGSEDRTAVELLVTVFERSDLPGSLRGEAADKLGCCAHIRDRRRRLFRRCRDTASTGLNDKSIDVQFWSMYLIGSLCSIRDLQRNANSRVFAAALPKLRKIAANDRRLAPGYWWPMSAEAEDIIGCIQTGSWPHPDAADRWIGNSTRGELRRD